MIEFIISLFSEKKCFSCQKLGHFFCPDCLQDLEIYSPYCYLCKKGSVGFHTHEACREYFPLSQVIVLTRYRHSGVKKLLRHAKYYGKYSAYKDILVGHDDFFLDFIETENSVFIPVPMHYLRRWKRGYNQSEVIAQNLSKICNIPVNNNFVKRTKYTKQQSHLSLDDRANNLSGVFSVKRNVVEKNSTIYLVDDVISTGSTVLEIANLLYVNGYNKVKVVSIASD